MATDDAPIRVKNHELEVDLLSKDPGDVWDALPQEPGHGNEREYQPKNSQRKHDSLVLVAIKSDGTWCEDRPYVADTIKIFYGNPANHTANTKPTLRIRVHTKKVKAMWIDTTPTGQGSKALKYDQTGSFMYRVEASGRSEDNDLTCTTDSADTKIYLQLFEMNEEDHRRH